MNCELTFTIITEISSLTEAEIYSISQLPKQLNLPVKQGQHFLNVQWTLDSPWAVCPSAPEAEPGSAGAPAEEQGILALCRAKLSLCSADPRASPALLGRSLRHKSSQIWQVQHHNWGWQVLNYTGAGNHNSSLEWRSVQQDQPGILHAATWGSTLHCPFPVLWPVICHPSGQSWSRMTDIKGNILILMFKITMLKIDRFLQ